MGSFDGLSRFGPRCLILAPVRRHKTKLSQRANAGSVELACPGPGWPIGMSGYKHPSRRNIISLSLYGNYIHLTAALTEDAKTYQRSFSCLRFIIMKLLWIYLILHILKFGYHEKIRMVLRSKIEHRPRPRASPFHVKSQRL